MRRLALAFVVAGLLVAASAAPAAARTTRIAVEGQAVTHVVDPGATTQSGTVLSVRGQVMAGYGTWNTKYFTGPQTEVVNYDIDLATGNGHMWGWGRHTPAAVPGGSWYCAFADTFTGGVYAGRAACIGTGRLSGWLLSAEMHQTGADSAGFTGFMLQPHR